jgi:3-methyl-2-oxobutanoate hydroxymethyltransferase
MAAGDDARVSIHDLRAAKRQGQSFAVLTAYDHPTARILDDAGIPVLLVGDSVGTAVLGYDSTIPVTLEEMLHHVSAVARGAHRALVVADMPFGSYQAGEDAAMANAVRLLKEGGANAVKIEGGGPSVALTRRLTQAGVPAMGHVGLTPQSVNQLGGHRVQGRDAGAGQRILADAQALAEAGAFAVVLECVPADLGRAVTEAVDVPTIGIGAGAGCDAQVLVLHDLLGLTSGPKPRFVKAYAHLREHIADAAKAFQAEVRDGDYPGPEHIY